MDVQVDPTGNLSDEARKKLAAAKATIQSTYGQVVLAMSSVPRYRNQALSDLPHLVIDPLISDRIAIATSKGGAELDAPAIAIWASVSEEVDAKISEQAKSGAFPVRLKPEDWRSGEIVWLLDVIAPTRELATAVLTNFNRVANKDSIKMHPIVANLVDGEVLRKLSAQTADMALN